VNWFEPLHTIQREETSDTLMFTVVPSHDGREWIISGVLVTAGAITICFHFVVGALLLIAGVWSAISQANETPDIIRASREGVYADARLYRWTEIQDLTYASEEDGPSGLALQTSGWGSTVWISTKLSRRETEQVVAEIYGKFYDAPMPPRPPSLWSELRSMIQS